jgi:hypothetical protein
MNVSASAALPSASALSLARILKLDALTCLVMGALLVLAHAPLAPLLGLPPMLLLGAGALLFPCAVLMWLAGADPRRRYALVWAVILGNATWIAASAGVAFGYTPTLPGLVFVAVQAAAVAVLMALEYRGLASPAA